MRARCLVALLALAAFSDSPVHAQEGSSCPVPIGKQMEAIGAFAEMLPVFRHPRCMNCHGGLDIMSERHPGADDIVPMANPLDVEQCQQCHDGLPGWRQPGSPVFFVDKSDEELCLQMKRFESTGDKFVEHIFNDHGDIQFIAAGFVGDRALGEELTGSRADDREASRNAGPADGEGAQVGRSSRPGLQRFAGMRMCREARKASSLTRIPRAVSATPSK